MTALANKSVSVLVILLSASSAGAGYYEMTILGEVTASEGYEISVGDDFEGSLVFDSSAHDQAEHSEIQGRYDFVASEMRVGNQVVSNESSGAIRVFDTASEDRLIISSFFLVDSDPPYSSGLGFDLHLIDPTASVFDDDTPPVQLDLDRFEQRYLSVMHWFESDWEGVITPIADAQITSVTLRAVPEPASLALLLVTSAGCVLRHRTPRRPRRSS